MRDVLLITLLLCGCAAGEPCQSDLDCKGERVCDAARGVCAEPAEAATLDLRRPPMTDERDMRAAADLLTPDDLRGPADLAPACTANLMADPNNCGSCGNVCPTRRRRGTMVMLQDACCSGFCRDLNWDSNNCGVCGNKCPPGSSCFDAGGIPIGGNCG